MSISDRAVVIYAAHVRGFTRHASSGVDVYKRQIIQYVPKKSLQKLTILHGKCYGDGQKGDSQTSLKAGSLISTGNITKEETGVSKQTRTYFSA